MLSLLQTHCQIFYPLFIKVALRYISTLSAFYILLKNLINCCPLTYFSLCFRCFSWCGWEIYLSVGPTSLARATSARRGFSFDGWDTARASSCSRYGALLWPTEKKLCEVRHLLGRCEVILSGSVSVESSSSTRIRLQEKSVLMMSLLWDDLCAWKNSFPTSAPIKRGCRGMYSTLYPLFPTVYQEIE